MEETVVLTMLRQQRQALQDQKLQEQKEEQTPRTYILKPDRGSQGKGISLYSTTQPVPAKLTDDGEEVLGTPVNICWLYCLTHMTYPADLFFFVDGDAGVH